MERELGSLFVLVLKWAFRERGEPLGWGAWNILAAVTACVLWGHSAGYFKARLVNVGFPFVYLGFQYFPWHASRWSQNVGNQAREKINAVG